MTDENAEEIHSHTATKRDGLGVDDSPGLGSLWISAELQELMSGTKSFMGITNSSLGEESDTSDSEPATPTGTTTSHQWDKHANKCEKVGLLGTQDRNQAGFEDLSDASGRHTPPKAAYSYFARTKWLEMDSPRSSVDSNTEKGGMLDGIDPSVFGDFAFDVEDQEETSSPHSKRTGTFGLDFRCFRYCSFLALASAPLTWVACLLPQVVAGIRIDIGKVLLWQGLQLCGFAYVSGVTERRHPLLSRFGNFSEVTKIFLLGFLLYHLGPRFTLAGAPESTSRAFVFNYCYYTIPFIVGVNWTHLQRIPFLRGASLSPDGLKVMRKSCRAMVLCAFILLVVIAGAVNAGWHIHRSRYPWIYIAYALLLVFSVIGVTYRLRRSHELHLHHCFNCAVLIPFTGFDDPISAISQALLAAIYVEGSARFGMGYFVDQWNKRELGHRSEWSWCPIPLH